MSDDKMRAQFEAWYCKKFTFENMARRTDGTYRGEHAFNSWVSWQAALSQSEPVQVSQPVGRFFIDGRGIYNQVHATHTYDFQTVSLFTSPPDYEALKARLESVIADRSKVVENLRAENEALNQSFNDGVAYACARLVEQGQPTISKYIIQQSGLDLSKSDEADLAFIVDLLPRNQNDN